MFSSTPELALAYAQELSGGSKSNLHKTDNAYSVTKTVKLMTQFIHRWTYKDAEQLLASFDFTIAQACFWWDGLKWASLCSDRFYTDLASKRLVYTQPQRNEDAGGSMLRVLKFYQKGYRIPLDSLGAVMARLIMGVDGELRKGEWNNSGQEEKQWGKVLTGLLREVDPNIDPRHVAHLPSMVKDDEVNDTGVEL